MGVQVPELKQCVLQSFHFIVLSSSSLSSLLVLLLFREILLFVVFAPSKMRFGFAMTISLSLSRFSLLFLAPNETPSDEETLFSSSSSSSSSFK